MSMADARAAAASMREPEHTSLSEAGGPGPLSAEETAAARIDESMNMSWTNGGKRAPGRSNGRKLGPQDAGAALAAARKEVFHLRVTLPASNRERPPGGLLHGERAGGRPGGPQRWANPGHRWPGR